MYDDGTDRHFMLSGGFAGLPQGFPHEIGVVEDENVRFQAQDAALLLCFVKLET
jgi:hypothetical protein